MKKIGLLSDTHGLWDERFESYFSHCDEVWHAGDIGSLQLAERFERFKPFRAVYGNIDDHRLRAAFPHTTHFEVEGVRVLMTHIGGYPGKYDARALQQLQLHKPQLFICGHSHILRIVFDKHLQCLTINPGAAGKHGFHRVRTLLTFVLDAGKISDAQIIELG